MSLDTEMKSLIDRREAIKRVSALLGGAALIGGSALWTGCAPRDAATVADSTGAVAFTPFTAE